MIGAAITPNAVYVPMFQTGCLKAEFDSTYPVYLNGIINQDEYRESINRINRTITSTKILMILALVLVVSIIGGIIFFIVGGVTTANSRRYGLSPYITAGIIVPIFGSILFSIGCFITQFRRAARIRRAIAEESMRYSSRSPIPCSWRLDTTRHYIGRYGNNGELVNHLVIDIGRSIVPGNGTYYSNRVAPEPTVYLGRQDNYPPPPYSGQSTGFCPQCGTPRHDLTAGFCSSCGHSLNKY